MVSGNGIDATHAVCTFADGAYHFGLGALVNSLYRAGFRGAVWNGYRGALPPWAGELRDGPGWREFAVADGCVIRFVEMPERGHLAHMKPAFLGAVLDRYSPKSKAAFYFDVDIVVRYEWRFFADWVENGVCVCMDCSDPYMPENHPLKHQWKRFAAEANYPWRDFVGYFNSGFVGVPAPARDFLAVWEDALRRIREGLRNPDAIYVDERDRSHPFYIPDQDALNVAIGASAVPFSPVGPAAMGFAEPGNHAMLHAVFNPKPWQRTYGLRSILRGMPPTPADFAYWENADSPIALFPAREIAARKRRLKWAGRGGMVIRNLHRQEFG